MATSSPQYVDNLIKENCVRYNADLSEIRATIKGESNFKHDGIYGDHGVAYGIAQFHEETFYGFAKTMGFEGANYYKLEDQIKVMAWAFGQGTRYKRHWSAWRHVYEPNST